MKHIVINVEHDIYEEATFNKPTDFASFEHKYSECEPQLSFSSVNIPKNFVFSILIIVWLQMSSGASLVTLLLPNKI